MTRRAVTNSITSLHFHGTAQWSAVKGLKPKGEMMSAKILLGSVLALVFVVNANAADRTSDDAETTTIPPHQNRDGHSGEASTC